MPEKIVVIGAGTMGRGIAQVAAAAGHRVVVIDAAPDALERGKQGVTASLAALVSRSRLSQPEADALAGLIAWSTELTAASDAILVIEAIVERLDVKRQLLSDVAGLVADATVLSSNTSSLSIGAIAEDLPNPTRFVGLHFFNPVPVMKLVEVVAGPRTDPAIVIRMSELMRQWGKHPVAARDVPGFIVNRVARPFYAEAFTAFDEGIEPAVIDEALKDAGGFRMGPLALADMIGHDVNYAAATSVFDGLQPHVRFRPQPSQRRLVEAGQLGRKSGQGVFDYGTKPSATNPRQHADLGPLVTISGRPNDPHFSWLNGVQGQVEPVDGPAGYITVNGLLVACGDGRSLRTRKGVDAILDYVPMTGHASALVATVRSEAVAAAVAGLAALTGKTLVLIPDRAGQLVLRTLAQLANGAADALYEGIATAEAIDEAMLFGANYPIGPIQWARSFGRDRLKETLTSIADETKDDIYQPSAGIDLL